MTTAVALIVIATALLYNVVIAIWLLLDSRPRVRVQPLQLADTVVMPRARGRRW